MHSSESAILKPPFRMSRGLEIFLMRFLLGWRRALGWRLLPFHMTVCLLSVPGFAFI